MTKEEKHELNLRRRLDGIGAGDRHNAMHDEKENEDNRNLLRMVVAGTDPGSVAKYRKTMNNQKRRIRRRHTVGGTKDFAEWEALINAENSDKNRTAHVMPAVMPAVLNHRHHEYLRSSPVHSKTADDSIADALAHCGSEVSSKAGRVEEVAAVAAASRIIQRCSVAQQEGMAGLMGHPHHQWRTSSPDLVVLSAAGYVPLTTPKPVTGGAYQSHSVNKTLKNRIDRRLSLPESAMISPENTDDEGQAKIKPFPSLLESQV